MDAVSAQKLSDEKMAASTGKIFADWQSVLDAAGARDWKHPVIAAWLQSEHGVGGWWAQGITVGYEQAIGRRVPGQTADGMFAVSATKTIGTPRDTILQPVLTSLTEHLGVPESISPDSMYSTARWKIDGETIVAAISESKQGKTVVSLTRSRIIDGDSLASAKQQLRGLLDGLDA